MPAFAALQAELPQSPRRWLVTGAAGFIGSNLVEALLKLGQQVVGLDSFATGHRHNLEDVRRAVGPKLGKQFRFIEADIRDPAACREACADVDFVLHQAALGSVPRSIEDPVSSHEANVDGFLNMLVASKETAVRRFVYASSSSVYGDNADLPKVESRIGNQLSPYAVTKRVDELYAEVFSNTYGLETVGLRYFNVFGPRQDPEGAYAAVIPRWVASLLAGAQCTVYGDGLTSRDFCYIENVIQANLLAATAVRSSAQQTPPIYNIAYGEKTTLLELYEAIQTAVRGMTPGLDVRAPKMEDFRSGDIRHSLADISLAAADLGYQPTHSLAAGLTETVRWYVDRLAAP